MKYSALLTLLFFCNCCNKPERYSVYQSLMDNDYRAQVLYVGKNWEIKDAIHELGDYSEFHTKSFWSYANDKVLVVCASNHSNTIKLSDQVINLGPIIFVIPLDRFSKEYKLVKPN